MASKKFKLKEIAGDDKTANGKSDIFGVFFLCFFAAAFGSVAFLAIFKVFAAEVAFLCIFLFFALLPLCFAVFIIIRRIRAAKRFKRIFSDGEERIVLAKAVAYKTSRHTKDGETYTTMYYGIKYALDGKDRMTLSYPYAGWQAKKMNEHGQFRIFYNPKTNEALYLKYKSALSGVEKLEKKEPVKTKDQKTDFKTRSAQREAREIIGTFALDPELKDELTEAIIEKKESEKAAWNKGSKKHLAGAVVLIASIIIGTGFAFYFGITGNTARFLITIGAIFAAPILYIIVMAFAPKIIMKRISKAQYSREVTGEVVGCTMVFAVYTMWNKGTASYKVIVKLDKDVYSTAYTKESYGRGKKVNIKYDPDKPKYCLIVN